MVNPNHNKKFIVAVYTFTKSSNSIFHDMNHALNDNRVFGIALTVHWNIRCLKFSATSIALGLGCRSLYVNSLSLLLLLLLPFHKEQNLISPRMLSCHGWFRWWSTDEWISSYKWAKASGSVPENRGLQVNRI